DPPAIQEMIFNLSTNNVTFTNSGAATRTLHVDSTVGGNHDVTVVNSTINIGRILDTAFNLTVGDTLSAQTGATINIGNGDVITSKLNISGTSQMNVLAPVPIFFLALQVNSDTTIGDASGGGTLTIGNSSRGSLRNANVGTVGLGASVFNV